MDKSYSFEVLENLTPFVILVFLRVTQGKKEDIKHYFLKLFGLLFVKGHKIESQENIKKKFGIGVVFLVTHIYHYSTKSTFEISLIIEVL